MPEEYGIAESVTGTDASVAIDPSLLNKPVQPDAQSANGNDELLKHKLGLANQHAKKAKQEADEVRKQFESLTAEMNALKEAQQSAVRENLEGQGAFKELYDQEKSRAKQLESRLLNETAELKQQLESVTQNAKNERLKSAALQQISRSNAVNPNQLYTLLQPQLRTNEEGQPVLLNSGVEQPLGDYLANLKSSPDWQHHFSASGAKGMGAGAATTTVAPGMANPYRTRNLTEAMQLEVTNPELAKQLKAEALSGS
jgi:hypothetical protein